MTQLNKGFTIFITSWENDGDFYNTTSITGLNKESIKFIVGFLELFRSRNRRSDTTCYGNAPTQDGIPNVENYVKSYLEANKVLPKPYAHWCEGEFKIDDLVDLTSEIQYDLLGTGDQGDYYRVFEKAEVFYLPESLNEVDLKDLDNFEA